MPELYNGSLGTAELLLLSVSCISGTMPSWCPAHPAMSSTRSSPSELANGRQRCSLKTVQLSDPTPTRSFINSQDVGNIWWDSISIPYREFAEFQALAAARGKRELELLKMYRRGLNPNLQTKNGMQSLDWRFISSCKSIVPTAAHLVYTAFPSQFTNHWYLSQHLCPPLGLSPYIWDGCLLPAQRQSSTHRTSIACAMVTSTLPVWHYLLKSEEVTVHPRLDRPCS